MQTNNWWGVNNPTVSSTLKSDIYIKNGTVNYNPWIVLKIDYTSSTNSGGNVSVTADLTHNNQGGDTSSQGHIPNGLPVNFTTSLGTIVGTASTVKGRATTVLKLGNTESKTVTVSTSLDKQSVFLTKHPGSWIGDNKNYQHSFG